jgi:hypothetical protein
MLLDIEAPHVIRAALGVADVVPKLGYASTDVTLVGHDRILLEKFLATVGSAIARSIIPQNHSSRKRVYAILSPWPHIMSEVETKKR